MNTPPAQSLVGLGDTGLAVTPICFGTSPLASMAQLYGYSVDEERAVATVLAAFESPVNFIDTSNGYGEDGLAERRIGAAIRRAGGLPSHVVLATKVDPDPRTGDFSGDRVRASLEESMERLGVDKIALLHLHDPERISFEEGWLPAGRWRRWPSSEIAASCSILVSPEDRFGCFSSTSTPASSRSC